ncbi:uncharacterized protein LOC114366401 [Ostrinia furnacalis]|uniref:uncharacterized protein LOC114366401 n=1 Tax=Ostrinia furnacalis TaxID=93504 RepID=UPI00103F8A32|nr:uncharacterized protein LOC114366401 [Ostrinia furnacalis]
MNSMFYKSCAVPDCASTTIKTPEKLFIHVPRTEKRRIMWLQLAKRDPKHVPPQSKLYFCEDHFNLPRDMENYSEYRSMGAVSQIRMRAGCVPSKFATRIMRNKSTITPKKEKTKQEWEQNLIDILSKPKKKIVFNDENLASFKQLINQTQNQKLRECLARILFQDKSTQTDFPEIKEEEQSYETQTNTVSSSQNSSPNVQGFNQELDIKKEIKDEPFDNDASFHTPPETRSTFPSSSTEMQWSENNGQQKYVIKIKQAVGMDTDKVVINISQEIEMK